MRTSSVIVLNGAHAHRDCPERGAESSAPKERQNHQNKQPQAALKAPQNVRKQQPAAALEGRHRRHGDSVRINGRGLRLPIVSFCVCCVLVLLPEQTFGAGEEADGFVSLFNGQDLSGWIVPEGDNGHWQVVDGVIDYDAASEAAGDKNLWTEQAYGDFILKIDWRIKETSGFYDVPIVLQDGSNLVDALGKQVTIKRPNADSGIYVRGTSKAQLNIWCWPIGSGEVYGYRNRQEDPEIRAGVTPRVNADHPVGMWNRFEIIMIGDRLTVVLNDKLVLENAKLPDVPRKGPIALQHHGGRNPDGSYKPASSLVQFRQIWIKELPQTPVKAQD